MGVEGGHTGRAMSPLPTAPWARVALSLFVVAHVLAGAANVTRDTPAGEALRTVTKPWEKVLAVHQTWPMFAVPPRSTNWMRVWGEPSAGGPMVPLHPLPGEPPHGGVIWVYARGGKLERNAVAKKRNYLRSSMARALCREHPELASIQFERATRHTPPPRFGTSFLPRPDWNVSTTSFETYRCRR